MNQLSSLNVVPWFSFQPPPFFSGSYVFLILDYSILLNSAGAFFQKLHQRVAGKFCCYCFSISEHVLIHTQLTDSVGCIALQNEKYYPSEFCIVPFFFFKLARLRWDVQIHSDANFFTSAPLSFWKLLGY